MPDEIVLIGDREVLTTASVAERLASAIEQSGDRAFEGLRIVILPEDELRERAEATQRKLISDRAPIFLDLPGEARISPRRVTEMGDCIALLAPAIDAIMKARSEPRDDLPPVQSAKRPTPPPIRTGAREAARRRRQMERRAAKAEAVDA